MLNFVIAERVVEEQTLCEKRPSSELFWSECGKIRTIIPPNTDTFYAVKGIRLWRLRLRDSIHCVDEKGASSRKKRKA